MVFYFICRVLLFSELKPFAITVFLEFFECLNWLKWVFHFYLEQYYGKNLKNDIE